ncbi:COP1-interactive protein 1-like [Solanum dulcamara]|uniref:COP1-interactive protein 1-like n=1 Tax=Solanum dulcamara TaxID=45834 RepID=UPI0024868D01|nr:COP1-interactive protein 1-like [Solanum dulcamara]
MEAEMAKQRWKGSIKAFQSHMDPEKEEQLKGIKIEIENKVKRIVKLSKSMNKGSRDGNLRRRSELIHLVDDLHKQYQSLYAMYENLKGEVKYNLCSKARDEAASSSSPVSDSEAYHSPWQFAGEGSSYFSNTANHENANLDLDSLPDSPISSGQEPESRDIFKDSSNQGKEIENSMTDKLMNESAWLKEKVTEKEEDILSLTKKYEVHESERLAEIKRLEDQIAMMKLELETSCVQKKEFREQITCKSNEIKQLEAAFREKEDQFSNLLTRFQENQTNSKSRIDDLMTRAKSLQQELDSLHSERNEQLKSLNNQKRELELSLEKKYHEATVEVKDLTEKIKFLQQELEAMSHRKSEVELSLKEKNEEISECHIQIENLKEKLTSASSVEKETLKENEALQVQVKDLKLEVDSLCSQKSDLEKQIRDINRETYHSQLEKEELTDKMKELETILFEKKHELSTLQKKHEAYANDMSNQNSSMETRINTLQQQLRTGETENVLLQSHLEKEKHESTHSLTQMEKKNIELTTKITDQEKSLRENEDIIKKLNEEHRQMKVRLEDSKSNLQNAERKIEEMTEELRKKFEDGLRILSRRIRVAEQMHLENKEWYQKTRDSYEKENNDLKEKNARLQVGIRGIKDITLTANDTLASLDTVALKFEECTGHFFNRMSKVSCELKFVRDWVMRKNKGIVHVQDDLDCLLAQLDDKEAEILVYREKVWKSDNKIRELEKMIKEKDDGMLALKEEKREAIRQLCIWIDYHRSRSVYYQKSLSVFGSRKNL